MDVKIEFICSANKEPYLVQIEPDAMYWEVSPVNELHFIAVMAGPDFSWGMKPDFSDGELGFQVFPDGSHLEIKVFLNGELVYVQ